MVSMSAGGRGSGRRDRDRTELKVVVINLRVAAQIRGMFAGDSSTESGD